MVSTRRITKNELVNLLDKTFDKYDIIGTIVSSGDGNKIENQVIILDKKLGGIIP